MEPETPTNWTELTWFLSFKLVRLTELFPLS